MKTKKNKGGMIKKESNCLDVCHILDDFNENDCVAGSLLLLEYCDYAASSYLAARSPDGVSNPDILSMYSIAYDPDATFVNIDSLTDEQIIEILPPSFATILLYSAYMHPGGHATVLFNDEGVLKVLDPQRCKLEESSICSVLLSEHKAIRSYNSRLIIKSKETSEKFKITMDIIDSVLQKDRFHRYPRTEMTKEEFRSRPVPSREQNRSLMHTKEQEKIRLMRIREEDTRNKRQKAEIQRLIDEQKDNEDDEMIRMMDEDKRFKYGDLEFPIAEMTEEEEQIRQEEQERDKEMHEISS